MKATKSKDPILAEIVRRLVEAYEPERIYLFGSRARGDGRPESDYDLVVIVPDSASEERRDDRPAYRALEGAGVAVDALVWPRESFDRQTVVVASLPATVLREGRLLYADKRSTGFSDNAAGPDKEVNGRAMSPDEEKLRLTREWLEKVEQDLLAAERMSLPPAVPGIVAYHCQQAMEKALKGFLLWHDQPFRRTHELVELVQQCEPIDSAFAGLEEAARELGPYVAQFRYPTGVMPASPEQAARALRLAHESVDFVEARLSPKSS